MWKNHYKYRQLLVGLLLVALLFADRATAEIKGTPTIVDGDSLHVNGLHFQLFGIDAPEPGTTCWKENGDSFDCGRIATTALLDLTAGQDVICYPLDSVTDDRATPISAMCTAGGFSLNQNMVHTGWALADRTASSDYVAIEGQAKAAKRGLWRWKVQPPPWPSRPH